MPVGDDRMRMLRHVSTPRSLLGLLRLDSDVTGASSASSPACGSTPQQPRELHPLTGRLTLM